jgi:hypothetical protein
MTQIVSAIFDNRSEAEKAVSELRSSGVPDRAISIIAQHEGSTTATTSDGGGQIDDDADNKGSGIGKGVGVGAGVGALFGLAALAIPGVGPFITAGALASALGATGGSIAAGAIVGGTAGGLSGALMNYGVSEQDSHYYEERIGQGGVFVSVETGEAEIEQSEAEEILFSHGGHNASRARASADV